MMISELSIERKRSNKIHWRKGRDCRMCNITLLDQHLDHIVDNDAGAHKL